MRNIINNKVNRSRNIGIFRMAGLSKEDRINKSSKSTTNQKVKHNIIVILMILSTLIGMTKEFDFTTGMIETENYRVADVNDNMISQSQ